MDGWDEERLLPLLETFASRLEALADRLEASHCSTASVSLEVGLLLRGMPDSVQAVDDARGSEQGSEEVLQAAVCGATGSDRAPNSSSSNTIVDSAVALAQSSINSNAVVGSASEPPIVAEYRALLAGPLALYAAQSEALGGEMATLARLVRRAFEAQLDLVLTAALCKEPPPNIIADLTRPTADCLQAVQAYCQSAHAQSETGHAHSGQTARIRAIAESVRALNWTAVRPNPASFIGSMRELAERSQMDGVGGEESGAELGILGAWLGVLAGLEDYVKKFHSSGLQWKRGGRDVMLPPCGGPPPVGPLPANTSIAPCGGPPPPRGPLPATLSLPPSGGPPPCGSIPLAMCGPKPYHKPAPNPKPASMAGVALGTSRTATRGSPPQEPRPPPS